MGRVKAQLVSMGLTLPEPSPKGKLERAVRSGSFVFTSGVGSMVKGTVGAGLDLAMGRQAALECPLRLLANLEAEIGDPDNKVRRVGKLLAMGELGA